MRGKKAPAADREQRKDWDETRRVGYMVLAAAYGSEHIEAAGTLVNALVHHSKLADDADEAMRHVITLSEGWGDHEESLAWLKGHIGTLTDLLG